MAFSKIILNGDTLMDVTQDTVAANNLLSGETATGANGLRVNGAATVPTKTSDLVNDSDFVSDASYVHTDNNYTSAEKTKLSGIAAGAEVNVQANWNESNSSSDAFIKNKPTIPSKVSDLTNDSGFITAAQAPVQSVNGQTGAVTLSIPSAISDLTNDSDFLTPDDGVQYKSVTSIAEIVAACPTAMIPVVLSLNSGVMQYLAEAGNVNGTGYFKRVNDARIDYFVYCREDGAYGYINTDSTSPEYLTATYTSFSDCVNVQADWNETGSSSYAYIKNKPTIPSPSSVSPNMDGTAAVGSSEAYARADHRHPVDTSRAAANNASLWLPTCKWGIGSTTADGANPHAELRRAGGLGDYGLAVVYVDANGTNKINLLLSNTGEFLPTVFSAIGLVDSAVDAIETRTVYSGANAITMATGSLSRAQLGIVNKVVTLSALLRTTAAAKTNTVVASLASARSALFPTANVDGAVGGTDCYGRFFIQSDGSITINVNTAISNAYIAINASWTIA